MARRPPGLLACVVAGLALAALFGPRVVLAQLRVVQVRISGRAGLDSLARLGFEVAQVRRLEGYLHAVIVVSAETERPLRAAGYVLQPAPPTPAGAAAADTYRVYRSFEKPVVGIRATLEAWAAADPALHLDSIGASIEGRPILAMKIGAAAAAPERPNVLFMATHHAREWVSTEMAMKLIRWLADSLPAALRDARDLWVIPVENPDGYQYTFTTDRLWRKNRRLNGDGTVGVDPNRNYPGFWGIDNLGSSAQPISEIYRGAGPASEPETQAIVAFHAAHPPVVSVSYHTFSGLLLHPYGHRTGRIAPDHPVFEALAGNELRPAVLDSVPGSTIDHYHPGPGWHLYPTNGEYTDWAYRRHGTIAFTPELTSGCCTPVSNLYYDFRFPDDSGMVERVFRDNLPFAVAVIEAAADLATARGPSGLRPAAPRVEAIWPDAWINLEATAPRPFTLMTRTGAGIVVTRSLQLDSLDRGPIRARYRTDLRSDSARAVRVDGSALRAELLTVAGAEDLDAGWVGWRRSVDALVGTYAWYSGGSDTLTSPIVNLAGHGRVWLHFWNQHEGSTFAPTQRGVVQFSADSGASWADVAVISGAGLGWYPVRVDLPAAAGARGARVRFIASDILWWLDAVGFATDSTQVFDAIAVAGGGVEVSENPVRSDQVVIAWPAGTRDARIGVYTFAGERLLSATVPAPNNEFVWNLTVVGRRVVNGAYLVVVEVDGRVLRRRLFITRRGPP
ncbi:MAG: M14 family zinc carboxypeptidase [Gemmatimonadales bacterium]